MSVLLRGRNLSKTFGATRALDAVSFDLAAGEVKGLVGANGAGKSTLLKILAGALQPDEGELALDGKPLLLGSMIEAARKGIALVSQELNLFPALSIAENLTIVSGGAVPQEAARVLAELGLDVPLRKRVEELSLGDRQLVEIGRALLQHPRALILDEPTSALHKREKERLLSVVRALKQSGVAIIYVSHFLEEVLEISDGLIVLRDGKRITTEFAPSKERLGDVVSAMLGDKAAALGEPRRERILHSASGNGSLRISGLVGSRQLKIPQWVIPPGQVTGVAGLAGAGVEELFAILFGRARLREGTITLPSGALVTASTSKAVRNGVAYFPADRKRIGLMLQKSISENLCSVRSLVQKRDGFVLSRAAQDAISRERCDSLGVKAASMRQPVGALSGGNQQKVVFAKWLEADPALVLLDDPTRGVDVAAKSEMHRIVHRLADEGRVVLLYSSDPLELVSIADIVHVFVDGALTTQLQGDHLTEHGLVSAMNVTAARAS
jgi:ribose transport system ATP-binding protein